MSPVARVALLSVLAAAPAGCTSSGAPEAKPSATPVLPAPTATVPDDPLSPSPARESAAPLGRPACRASDLTVADADAVTSDEGVLVEVFAVRTTGPDCQLQGYPALRLLDAAGADLPVRVDRGGHGLPSRRVAPVTLSRSTSVSFELALPDGASCRDAAAAVVRLPGTTADLRVATSVRACGDAVGVSPVLRRVDDEEASG
jgi:hypothetical protein